MLPHSFILRPSIWLGEGKIRLSLVDEELSFITRWNISQKDGSGKIEGVQEIQVKGLTDVMFNQFIFSDVVANNFSVDLENQALGKVTGKGLISEKLIAWEFRIPDIGFEGFEFYEKQPDNTYLMRAEYATNDQFRTIINGKVWQKAVT